MIADKDTKNMRKVLSAIELEAHLNSFRLALCEFENNGGGNIVFFSLDSFLNFIDNSSAAENQIALPELFRLIEPYIPLTLDSRDMAAFINAAISNDSDELYALETEFVAKAKLVFINAASMPESGEQWHKLAEICQTIRKYKEDSE